jgi:CheY-like chemotaxis protein
LRRYQHVVIIANNGQEALDAFKQRKYDLVLMDISMPVMVSNSALRTA